jgi:Flp pilus assembly protein TadD
MTETIKKLAMGCGIAAAFFVCLEFILMAVGVVPLYERADPFVGFSSYAPLFVKRTMPGFGEIYETAPNKTRWFNPQRFPVHKAPGTTRVFCLGGSTTYGRPYDDRTSFSGWLREFLPSVDPTRRWEVINAGGISYASYRVARIMEELIEYEPDMFIVYSGHNEFLEQRTYDKMLRTPETIRNLATLASHLRTYSVLHDVTYEQSAVYERSAILSTEVKAVLDRSVGPDAYHRDDDMRDAILDHYQTSLMRMTFMAKRAGAKLILVTPASNIGDFSPFKAEPGPQANKPHIQKADSLKWIANQALEEEHYKRALAITEQALKFVSRDAQLLYAHGQALKNLGQPQEAHQALIKARDEDICPLRAITPIRKIVIEVAQEKETGLVDFVQIVREHSPDGIPGSELFLDHVHPTIEGNRILALALIKKMTDENIVTPVTTWNDATITKISEQVENTLDEQTHAMALKNLSRVLMWAGKEKEAKQLIDRAVTTTSEDGETHFHKATLNRRTGNNQAALFHYQEAVRLAPWNAAIYQGYGSLLSELGQKMKAREALETAIRLDQTQVEAYYDLGIVLEDLRQYAQAETAYRTTLKLDPNHADAHNNLGIILAIRGDLEAAATQFAEALRIAPNHQNAAKNFARAQSRLPSH